MHTLNPRWSGGPELTAGFDDRKNWKMSSYSPHQKRILLVSPSPPHPLENGTNQRTFLLWKALSEIAPVDIVLCDDAVNHSVTRASIPKSFNYLGRFPWRSKGDWIYRLLGRTKPHPKAEKILRVVLPRGWDYETDPKVGRDVKDILHRQPYFLAVGRYLKPIVKTGLVGQLPCLLDVDDVDFHIFSQRSKENNRPWWERSLYSAQSSQIREAFGKWLPQFQGLWVTKTEDTRYPVTRQATVLPNIPFNAPADEIRPAQGPVPVLLTVAFYSYKPNRDGVGKFLSEVWPKIRAACPTAEYWLAGKHDAATGRRWAAIPGVKVLGFVKDLAPLYEKCWFTVCPLWTGAGTNIKVLESLAFSRTCVSTVLGHRGYEHALPVGESMLVADDPEGLGENCIQLIKDPAKRQALSWRGREIVQREYSYQKFASIVQEGVERVLGAPVR
jgi:glycosyltransferase involved in cell wall biosynthesis